MEGLIFLFLYVENVIKFKLMKKIIGIILIVIASLNIIVWFSDFAKGDFESPIYYILILALLVGGIWLVMSNKSINQKDKE